jgi:hypothetical protein
MASLVLMYVYFDSNNDIKAITPMPDDVLANGFGVATFPLPSVEMFMLGQKNPFDFTVKKIKRIGSESYVLVKKETHINITRTLDNYLTKVSESVDDVPILKIIADVSVKHITMYLDKSYKDIYKFGSEDEKEDIESFINYSDITLYFTGRNDPYYLLHTLVVSPRELFEADKLYVPYPEYIDLSLSSVYTRKVISSYGYKIRGVNNGV